MRRTRIVLVSLLSVAVLALAAEPVAAQSAPSATAELINTLNGKLLYAAVPITILVEAILFYTVLKFRDNDEAQPTRENRRLEISWTIATALVLLFVGVASYGVMANENVIFQQEDPSDDLSQEDAVVVHAEAYQWGWDMSYPEENVSGTSNIVIPKDRPVYFEVTSRDVIHAFHVPDLGLKQDAMPGEVNTIRTVAYEEGSYDGYCAEFCGVSHSAMGFTVEVRDDQGYQNWLQEQQSGGDGGGSGESGNGTATETATSGAGSLAAPALA